MKKVLYLSFYFEPDLCAGSFRNTPLVKKLAEEIQGEGEVHLFTTLPNRYSTFSPDAPQFEECGNLKIRRIAIPGHQSGMKDQVQSFRTYYNQVRKHVRGQHYDLVVASSSRLFTAFLGYSIAKRIKAPLYLDIRDIFYDTLEDVLPAGLIKKVSLPLIKEIEKRTFGYANHINLISEGFKSYFAPYSHAKYSYFTNGIDDVFIDATLSGGGGKEMTRETSFGPVGAKGPWTIVYAGNVGEGQGLHKIIPAAAKRLGSSYKFVVIGDGGAKQKLVEKLRELDVTNVILRDPVKRNELIQIYKEADYLFVHLNNYKAFERVLPSKFFELATFPQPIIAGVGGYAAEFVMKNIENSILFDPCNVDELVSVLQQFKYKIRYRTSFINNFKRNRVNKDMVMSMIAYL